MASKKLHPRSRKKMKKKIVLKKGGKKTMVAKKKPPPPPTGSLNEKGLKRSQPTGKKKPLKVLRSKQKARSTLRKAAGEQERKADATRGLTIRGLGESRESANARLRREAKRHRKHKLTAGKLKRARAKITPDRKK